MTPFPLQTRHLVRTFGDEIAIDGLDLDVGFGEIHAIVGLNGAGKTTLMRLMLGMLAPDSGEALVMGHHARSAPLDVWSGVGHLIEMPFAYPELTVGENLGSAATLHGVDRSEIPAAVERSIEEFELGHWSERRSSELSLGNRQRLGLASALIHGPSIVVFDEPANSLDPAGVVFIRDLLRSSAGKGTAVFISSHHLDELARVADRITVLHRGRIVGSLQPGGTDMERAFFDLVYEADVRMKGGVE